MTRRPPQRTVHLWRLPLEPAPATQVSLAALLTPDERERAAAFHFERDRRRFAAARGALRRVLGDYLGIAPETIRFVYGPQGKPALAGEELQFNLTHSGEWALLAVSDAPTVGVDLEQVRSVRDLRGVARRFFAPGEVARLLALPADEQPAAFFQCWTRKEAFIKALGSGLSHPLDRFEVAFGPDVPARLVHIAGDAQAAGQWALLLPPAPPGYEAAVAVAAGWSLQVANP